jgi:glycine cleavage system H protein
MSDHQLDSSVKYAAADEWVRMEDGVAVVGISDYAQDQLSDVVYVELPEVGSTVAAGDEVAVVESVKAAETVSAPLSGTVVAVNEDLVDAPELVNEDPYQAWFFKLQPGDGLEEELAQLMEPDDYAAYVATRQ